MMKKTRRAADSEMEFAQFLVDQTPRFDELIMQDIRPTDGWLLNVSGVYPVRVLPDWWMCRESVRKICEGACYRKSRFSFLRMGSPVEETLDRFRAVWPNVHA